MTTKASGIYRITAMLESGVQRHYIGQAKDIRVRAASHFRSLDKGTHWNLALQNDYTRMGRSAFSFSVVLICQTDKVMLALYEQIIVNSYDLTDLYNIRTMCVISGLGVVASPERRAKIANAHRGRKSSLETRAKIGAAQSWKKTPEGREKLSKAHIGRPQVSQQTRDKMSRSQTGRVRSQETKDKTAATRALKKAQTGSVYSPQGLARIAESNRRRCGGVSLTDETKKKLSAALAGRTRPPEVGQKISASKMGKKRSQESIEKTRIGLIGYKHTPQARKNMGDSHRGFKHSSETIEKMRASRLRNIAMTASKG